MQLTTQTMIALVCCFAIMAGCNPPVETIPKLRPQTKKSSGSTSSGMTSSGMTGSSGITLPSSGTTVPGGLIPPTSGVTQVEPEESRTATKWVAFLAKEEPVSVKLASFDELQAKLKEFHGKVVVVDVWSTSCIPCMQEFPNLVALGKRFPDDVACISLNVDYIGLKKKTPESYLPKIEEFLIKQKAQITNLAANEPDDQIREKLEVSSIPAILIYDAAGKLVHRLGEGNSGDDGLTYEGDVIPKVEALLAQN